MGCTVFVIAAALIVGMANVWGGLLLLLTAFVVALFEY